LDEHRACVENPDPAVRSHAVVLSYKRSCMHTLSVMVVSAMGAESVGSEVGNRIVAELTGRGDVM
jgi:hypothetical protein